MYITQKNITYEKPQVKREAVCGKYLYYPDNTGKRKAEGGLRLSKMYKQSMPNKPLVSIITTVLNQDKFIEKAICSVLTQSHDNIEYIIVDAASTDKTLNQINKYEDSIDYFISEPDSGLYAGLNKGLSLASGDYILILNSDDWYKRDCVKILLEAIENNDADAVSALAIETDVNGNEIRKIPLFPFGDNIRIRMPLRHETMLISNTIYNKIGPYDESYKLIADFKLAIKLFEEKVKFFQSPVYVMCFRKIGMAHKVTDQLICERKRLLGQQFPFLNTIEIELLSNDFTGNFSDYKNLLDTHKNNYKFIKSIEAFFNMIGKPRNKSIQKKSSSKTSVAHNISINDKHVKNETATGRTLEMQHKKKVTSVNNESIEILENVSPSIYWNNGQKTKLCSINTYESKKPHIRDESNSFNSKSKDQLKVLTFCCFDHGGAGTGSCRRVSALRKIGIDARLLSLIVNSSNEFVGRLEPTCRSINNSDCLKVWILIRKFAIQRAHQPGFCAKEMFSLTDSVIDFRQLNFLIHEYDIIHFHWMAGMLDYKHMSSVLGNKPVAWTLADMNCFTGGCHYSEGCKEFMRECKDCPLLGGNSVLAHESWKIKRKAYAGLQNLNIICPSNWIAELAKKSSLLGDRPIHVISNAYPIDCFVPVEKNVARKKLELPIDKKLVLFGADSLSSFRKGGDLLQEAVNHYCTHFSSGDIEAVVFGQGALDLCIPTHSLGHIKEDSLALVYSAVDVFVSASREDVGPMTVGESLLCGTPVVGFPVGILPEIAVHKSTAYLAKSLDATDLAKGISWALNAVEKDLTIFKRCQQSGKKYCDPNLSARRHKLLYEKMLNSIKIDNKKSPLTTNEQYKTVKYKQYDNTISSDHTSNGKFKSRIFTSIAPKNIEHQLKCINSWVLQGFLVTSVNCREEVAKIESYFPNVEFITVNRDAKYETGLPLVYIDDLLGVARESHEKVVGFVNSDIIIEGLNYDKLIDFVNMGLVYGHRMDINPFSSPFSESYRLGIDCFFIHKKFIDCLSGNDLIMGRTWWDFLFPCQALARGLKIFQLNPCPTFHLWHENKSIKENEFIREAKKYHFFISQSLKDLDQIKNFNLLKTLHSEMGENFDRAKIGRLAQTLCYIFQNNSSMVDICNKDNWLSSVVSQLRPVPKLTNVFMDYGWHKWSNVEDWVAWSPGLGSLIINTNGMCVCELKLSLRTIHKNDTISLIINNGNDLAYDIVQDKLTNICPINISCISGNNIIQFTSKKDPVFAKNDFRPLNFGISNIKVRFLEREKKSELSITNIPKKNIFVITPCLNVVDSIDKTILSVISQTGDFFIRYHIQDGGSTDGTIDRLRDWEVLLSKPNPRVQCRGVTFTWSSEHDQGMYDGIIKGFDSMNIAPREFMAWINGDDILLPDTLATITRIAAEHPEIQWIGSHTHNIDQNGKTMTSRPNPTPTAIIREGLCDGHYYHWYHLQQEGTFFKKSLWFRAKHVLRGYSLAGDWALWRELARHAEYYQFGKPLGAFRKRDGQLSIARRDKYNAEIEATLPMKQRDEAFQRLYAQRDTLPANVIRIGKPGGKIIVEKEYKIVQKMFDKFWKKNSEGERA